MSKPWMWIKALKGSLSNKQDKSWFRFDTKKQEKTQSEDGLDRI